MMNNKIEERIYKIRFDQLILPSRKLGISCFVSMIEEVFEDWISLEIDWVGIRLMSRFDLVEYGAWCIRKIQ